MPRPFQAKLALVVLIACGLGSIPCFFPPYIADYSREDWDAEAFAGLTGDAQYFNDTFPSLPIPTNLTVVDIGNLPLPQRIALTTLQGLVNRKNSSLFLLHRGTDYPWVQSLKTLNNINYSTFSYSTYTQVIARFQDVIEGLVIYDDALPDSINFATFLAGVYNCVVVQQDMLGALASLGITTIKYDLRGVYSNRLALYKDAWSTYGHLATNKMACSLDPNQAYFRDYIVAHKIFTFYLCPGPFGPVEEINLFKAILATYPPNIPMFGWFYDPGGAAGEYEAVKILSKAGQYSLCAATPNLSILSAVPLPPLKQQTAPFSPESYPISNKIYVTVIVSDGDNVNYCMERLRYNWGSPDRGTVPVGITLEPLMFRICPTVLQYYYTTSTPNEYFLAGPSGAGYCYPDLNPAFPAFLNHTKYAFSQADMSQTWILNGYEAFQLDYSAQVLDAYASIPDLSAIYLNYHDNPYTDNFLTNNQVPVFNSIFVERVEEAQGKLLALSNAHPQAPIFAFVGFWAWDFSFGKLKNLTQNLGTEFVFLRPDQFAQLYSYYQSSKPSSSSAGLLAIPLSLIVLLSIVWFQGRRKLDPANKRRVSLSKDSVHNFIGNVDFIVADWSFLLVSRFLLYSTILHLFSFLYFLIGITLGISLKGRLTRSLNDSEIRTQGLAVLSGGLLLMVFSPKFAGVAGFGIGYLLLCQLQAFRSQSSPSGGSLRYLVYFLVLSACGIMLIPSISLVYAVLATGLLVTGLAPLIWHVKMPTSVTSLAEQPVLKWGYPKGIVASFLLYFLLTPTLYPERVFFHVLSGDEFLPTSFLLISVIFSAYLGSILILEFASQRGFNFQRWVLCLVLIAGMLLNLCVPLLLTGPIALLLGIFPYIFGFFLVTTRFFERDLMQFSQNLPAQAVHRFRGGRSFLTQLTFWILLGFALLVIPPSIFVVDAQEIFSAWGFPALRSLSWSPQWWAAFYYPPLYTYLTIPFNIGLVINALLARVI